MLMYIRGISLGSSRVGNISQAAKQYSETAFVVVLLVEAVVYIYLSITVV